MDTSFILNFTSNSLYVFKIIAKGNMIHMLSPENPLSSTSNFSSNKSTITSDSSFKSKPSTTTSLQSFSLNDFETATKSFDKRDASTTVSLKSFSLNDLKTATKNFSSNSYLGEGGFGCVFKGWIDEHTYVPTRPGVGIVVAIKKLKRESFQGHKEWLDFNAKLSDFGLARNGPTGDKSHVSTRVVGTRGYAAPEYIATGHLSLKSDIYSLGVVLLELLSGKRALDEDSGSTEKTLVDWAKPFLNDKRKMLRIMDTRLEGQYSKKEAQTIAALVL
ncbi:hypothetical protein BHE74_00002191 [Ensete ventricosum]|nr:hypothetical protein BHE74_00002191 [Ensete ventricosum]